MLYGDILEFVTAEDNQTECNFHVTFPELEMRVEPETVFGSKTSADSNEDDSENDKHQLSCRLSFNYGGLD